MFKFSGKSLRIISRESSSLEFKENFNWHSKDEYGKVIASFSNNKGGKLVFGVSDNPRELKGLPNDNFGNFDESKITEYLNSCFSPEIKFSKHTEKIKGKTVGWIDISESDYKPVMAIKNDGCLKEAEIYYRYNAKSEKIKYSELRNIIDDIKERERKNYQTLFSKLSKAEISDVSIAEVGDKGESVRITRDPSAPEVRIKEDNLLSGYWDYRELTDKLCDRYVDFKQNQKYHDIRNRIKGNPNYCRIRLLDPNNPDGARKSYYHPDVLNIFDRYYQKK